MKDQNKLGFFSNLKSDLPASIVVFLVALPLCLGIALASGAPLFSGIIAGVVGGTIVALMSGSPLGVSGPAAGLAIIVLNAIDDLGGFEIFLVAVVLSGVIQILLGIIRAGIIGYYFPNSVIKGMLAGIGIIIFIKQIPHAFGYDKDPEGDWEFFQTDGHTSISDLGYMWDFITPTAITIALISLTILILWERPFVKQNAVLKLIPGPLLAVFAGIGINLLAPGIGLDTVKAEHLVTIPVPDSVESFAGQFSFPDFSVIMRSDVWIVALTMAIVASLETLLCVEATDKLDPLKRITPTNRELIAQGTGNIASGLIGGLPITQVIVRSSANVQSGGKTKASAFFHGILLLVSIIAIPNILNMIPLASLAAVLLVVGYKLAKPSIFVAQWKAGMGQFLAFFITVVGIVFGDLLIGISLGLVVGVFQILHNNFKTPFQFENQEIDSGETITITLAENVSFLNKAGILHSLMEIPDGASVIIDGTKTKSIHPDVVEILEDFSENAKNRNISFELVNLDTSKQQDPVGDFGKVMRSSKKSKMMS